MEGQDQVIIDPVVDPIIEPTPTPTPTPTPPVDLEAIKTKAFGYAMNMVDEALKEAGYEKPKDIKSTEYIKQILADKGTKQVADPVTDKTGDTEARIKALQSQLLEKEQQLKMLGESTQKQKRDYFLNSIIEGANITAPENLGETEKQRYIERIKRTMNNELATNYQVKEVEGQFRFYTAEGQPIFDNTADLNHIKPTELLKRDFSEFLTSAVPIKKAVSGTGGLGDKLTPPTDRVIPSAIKTRSEFYDHLEKEKGYKLGDKNFTEAVRKAMGERPDMFK